MLTTVLQSVQARRTSRALQNSQFDTNKNTYNNMSPSKDELNAIAVEAEASVNTYQAKTGRARRTAGDGPVDTTVEKRFPGAEVKYGEDLSTNAGYNRRIPPDEGGEVGVNGR